MDKDQGNLPDIVKHVPTSPDVSGQWLSVTDSVPYCAQQGLHRNIKTIRRWAERSLKRPDRAEVKVREQDTGFGFRYMIERGSLDLKIKQELEFEAKQASADTAGHDQAQPDMPGATRHENRPSISERLSGDMPGHDQASPDAVERKLHVQTIGDDFLKSQIKEKDGQITQLNKQLERRDEQIMTMLERDRETNILIRGLQDAVTGRLQLERPRQYRDHDMRPDDREAGDNDHTLRSEPDV